MMARLTQSDQMNIGDVWPLEYFGPNDIVKMQDEFGTVATWRVIRQVPGLRQWYCHNWDDQELVERFSWSESAELVERARDLLKESEAA